MPGFKALATAGALLTSAFAAPTQDPLAASAQQQLREHPYVPPGATDSRAPCPLLNTLANHGFLPHNGRNLSRDMLITAIGEAVNVEESAIDLAIINALHVCSYVEGHSCDTLTNLTVLAEPHSFEHEHSMSRQDYRMAYAHGAQTNNQNFNQTIFDGTLNSFGRTPHMNYSQAAVMRLFRQSASYVDTFKGFFKLNVPVAMFEVGFIYAIMGDFNLPDYATTPEVRVEWWEYWFEHEALPVPLGWHKPAIGRDANFMLSVSSVIVAEHASTTAMPQPSGGTDNTAPAPAELPNTPPDGSAYPLPTDIPYKNPPTNQPVGHARAIATPVARAADSAYMSKIASAESALGPAPTMMNPYMEEVPVEMIHKQQAYFASRGAKIASMVN